MVKKCLPRQRTWLTNYEPRNLHMLHSASVTSLDRQPQTTNEGICKEFRDLLSETFQLGAQTELLRCFTPRLPTSLALKAKYSAYADDVIVFLTISAEVEKVRKIDPKRMRACQELKLTVKSRRVCGWVCERVVPFLAPSVGQRICTRYSEFDSVPISCWRRICRRYWKRSWLLPAFGHGGGSFYGFSVLLPYSFA